MKKEDRIQVDRRVKTEERQDGMLQPWKDVEQEYRRSYGGSDFLVLHPLFCLLPAVFLQF